MNAIQKLIIDKRKQLGVSQKEFASLIGLSELGERTVRRWENGENEPSKSRLEKIKALNPNHPYQNKQNSDFKFIDLFAGIGGIRLPFQQHGGECVFTSEIDKHAQKTYFANYGEYPQGDITQINATDIPDHDILLAGFPCQAFSQAGLKQGFDDTRGTMFFEIQRILAEKRPKMFLLENVKTLRTHDKGKTFQTIHDILTGKHQEIIPDDLPMSEEARKALGQKLNYWIDFKVLRAGDFGIPQNRERIFIVGFNRDYFRNLTNDDFEKIFRFPTPTNEPTRVGDILENVPVEDTTYTISDNLWNGHQKRKLEHGKKGNGFGYSLFNADSPYTNTISARYYKDGSEALIDQSHLGKNPRMLTPRECARLQGFPEDFIVDSVSKGQAYKQFGNSVCVKVIDEIAKNMISALNKANILQAQPIIQKVSA